MKAPIIGVCSINLDCPECEEGIESPISGSYNFDDVEIIHVQQSQGGIVTCQACGAQLKLPANPWKPTPQKKNK
jgi:hypothetical protein